MGADIHMVLERHTDEEGWVGINAFDYIDTRCLEVYFKEQLNPKPEVSFISWDARDRNYELFAALASVRGDGPDPKGMPEDASDLTRMKVRSWGEDGHSHTWYTLKEAAEIFARIHGYDYKAQAVTHRLTGDYAERPVPPELRFFGVDVDEDDEDIDDYRVVFWWDN